MPCIGDISEGGRTLPSGRGLLRNSHQDRPGLSLPYCVRQLPVVEQCLEDGTPSNLMLRVSPAELYTAACTNVIGQGVFTYLVDNLGVKDIQFEELIALDADYLKQQRFVSPPSRL